jgi:hypothetical protein
MKFVVIHVAECCELLQEYFVLEPSRHMNCWHTQHYLVFATNKYHRGLDLGILGAKNPC